MARQGGRRADDGLMDTRVEMVKVVVVVVVVVVVACLLGCLDSQLTSSLARESSSLFIC